MTPENTAEGQSLFCCPSRVVLCHWTSVLLFRRQGWSERTAKTLETLCQNLKFELECCKCIFPCCGLGDETWLKECRGRGGVTFLFLSKHILERSSLWMLWGLVTWIHWVSCFNMVGTSPTSYFCLLTINWFMVMSALKNAGSWFGPALLPVGQGSVSILFTQQDLSLLGRVKLQPQ